MRLPWRHAPNTPPELPAESYPPYVSTAAERRRWEAAVAIAEQVFEGDSVGVWMAARSIYRSGIPTDS